MASYVEYGQGVLAPAGQSCGPHNASSVQPCIQPCAGLDETQGRGAEVRRKGNGTGNGQTRENKAEARKEGRGAGTTRSGCMMLALTQRLDQET